MGEAAVQHRVRQAHMTVTMTVPVRVWPEGGWVYASCEDLDIHTQGRTEAEARSNLVEALQLFVQSCFERGTLDAVLKQAGFRPARRRPDREREAEEGSAWLDVPLSLVARRGTQDHTGRMGNAR